MSSTGELKKRIEKAGNAREFLTGQNLVAVPEILILLDEARKEIFNSIPIEEIKGLTKNNPELLAKLLKWFGQNDAPTIFG